MRLCGPSPCIVDVQTWVLGNTDLVLVLQERLNTEPGVRVQLRHVSSPAGERSVPLWLLTGDMVADQIQELEGWPVWQDAALDARGTSAQRRAMPGRS